MMFPLVHSEPHYPDAAVPQRLEGAVELLVTIDPEGVPISVEALQWAADAFEAGAMDAATW